MTDVSVLGTGLMGSAITRAYLAAGKSVTVWNRTPDKAAALGDEGARVASTPAEALTASPVTVIVLPGYEVVEQVLGTASGQLAGRVLVNLTTGQPDQARALESWATAHDASLLDGCILEYPSEIGDPAGKLKYGGSTELWEQWRDLLMIMGGESELVGNDIRAGNIVDSASLTFYIAACAAVVEAGAYAAAYDMDFADLAPHLKAVGGTNLQWLISNTADKIASDSYVNEQATVDVYLDAVDGIAAAMAAVGFTGRMTEATGASLRLARDAGSGGADFAAIYPELLRPVRARAGS